MFRFFVEALAKVFARAPVAAPCPARTGDDVREGELVPECRPIDLEHGILASRARDGEELESAVVPDCTPRVRDTSAASVFIRDCSPSNRDPAGIPSVPIPIGETVKAPLLPAKDAHSEEETRIRAYLKWEAAGKPKGLDARYWYMAREEFVEGK